MLIINIVTFVYYGIDKYKAKQGKWRIPESTLLMLAVAGGAVGAWIAMMTFRHKTLHWKFRLPVPILSVLWVGLTVYLLTL